jgi:hypothetical protein
LMSNLGESNIAWLLVVIHCTLMVACHIHSKQLTWISGTIV